MSGAIAAIDCGTNTIKLLIGDLPDVAVREMRIVRLGQGVDRTGRLADEALERTFAAIDEYAALIDAHRVPRSGSASAPPPRPRDAANGDVFAAGVRKRLGVSPEVISGDEEAALAFDGAVRHLRTRPEAPVLVIDIGGGSTELILGTSRSRVGALHGHRLGPPARTTPALRPADAGRGRRPASPTSTPPSTRARSTSARRPPWSAWPAP